MKGDKVKQVKVRLWRALQATVTTLAFVLSSWKAIEGL